MAAKRKKPFTKRDRHREQGTLYREYYHEAFDSIRAEIVERGLLTSGISAKRRSYWQFIPPGRYAPAKGREYVDGYLRSVSEALRIKVSSNCLAYWLHLYRRVFPGAIGLDKDPMTILWTRKTLEAAVHKWAPLELCNRIAISDQVDGSRILRGFLTNHEPETLVAVQAAPQLVLTDFGAQELAELFEIEKLAYEIWKCMSLLRMLAKGAPLIVDFDDDEVVFDGRDDDLDYLVTSFDKRVTPISVTATGTVFSDELAEDGWALFPRYNIKHETAESVGAGYKAIVGKTVEMPFGNRCPNFIMLPFNLASFYRSHQPFRIAFVQKHGVSLESVIALLGAIGFLTMKSWRLRPELFLRHNQRAYEGPVLPQDIIRSIEPYLTLLIKYFTLQCTASEIDLAAAIAFLSLTGTRENDVDIAYAGPHAVFLPAGGGRVFVDQAYVTERLYHLYYGLSLADQNFKGAALELITHGGDSALPTAELKAKDNSRRQIDASFSLADTLVIAECRVVARSIGFDRGDPAAIQKRNQVVERTLDDIDEKARWLASRQQGTNYDVRRYKRILPVGVTPFAEYIPSRAARYWINDQLPRVLTPSELQEALKDGSIAEAAKSSVNAVNLE